MIVLDASAILAFLHDEQGADRVEESLDESVVGAANWSEIAQKSRPVVLIGIRSRPCCSATT